MGQLKENDEEDLLILSDDDSDNVTSEASNLRQEQEDDNIILNNKKEEEESIITFDEDDSSKDEKWEKSDSNLVLDSVNEDNSTDNLLNLDSDVDVKEDNLEISLLSDDASIWNVEKETKNNDDSGISLDFWVDTDKKLETKTESIENWIIDKPINLVEKSEKSDISLWFWSDTSKENLWNMSDILEKTIEEFSEREELVNWNIDSREKNISDLEKKLKEEKEKVFNLKKEKAAIEKNRKSLEDMKNTFENEEEKVESKVSVKK